MHKSHKIREIERIYVDLSGKIQIIQKNEVFSLILSQFFLYYFIIVLFIIVLLRTLLLHNIVRSFYLLLFILFLVVKMSSSVVDTNEDNDVFEIEHFIDDNCYNISSLSIFYCDSFSLDGKEMKLSYSMSVSCSPLVSAKNHQNNIPIKLNIGDTFISDNTKNIIYLSSILVYNNNHQNEEDNFHGRVLHLFLNDLNGTIKSTLINLQSKGKNVIYYNLLYLFITFLFLL